MRSLRLLIWLAALAMPLTASAQKLAVGRWTGTIAPPDNDALNAIFDVHLSGDTTKITLMADGHALEAADVTIEAKRLLFTFSPGNNTIRCTLLLQADRGYSGDCLDPDGGKGVITMHPPKP
jgi:hypothetical protein